MRPTILLLVIASAAVFDLAVHSRGQASPQLSQPPEAITGFDDESNGFSEPTRRTADQKVFEEVEHIAPDGLGPLYNAHVANVTRYPSAALLAK